MEVFAGRKQIGEELWMYGGESTWLVGIEIESLSLTREDYVGKL